MENEEQKEKKKDKKGGEGGRTTTKNTSKWERYKVLISLTQAIGDCRNRRKTAAG